ncbi:MAG: hypothetical protein ACREKI_00445 [Gemmatimonadota bacterium]
MRSVLAVAAGYVVLFVVVVVFFAVALGSPAATPSPGFLAASLVVGFLAAGAGGWTTATIARGAEMQHAGALVGLVVALGIVSLLLSAGREPLWYALANVAVGAGGVLLGGYVRYAQVRGSPPGTPSST